MFTTLMYHLVDDEIVDPMSISVAQLTAQLSWLEATGVRCISLSEAVGLLARGEPIREPRALLTFDDGYRNTIHTVLPLLERFSAPALLAVCASYVLPALRPKATPHASQDFADEADLARWLQSGRDIAGHSYSHAKLTTATDDELVWQVMEDKRLLERALGSSLRAFVYPFGSVDARVREVLAHEYSLAFTDERGQHPRAGDRFMLRRLRIRPEWSTDHFANMVQKELESCAVET